MVMEKALPQLPTELVKIVEEFAGIYRLPGYKNLDSALKEAERPNRYRTAAAADAIHNSIFWKEWWYNKMDRMSYLEQENWAQYLKWLLNCSNSDNTGNVLRIN